MNKKLFRVLFCLVILLAFVERLIPTIGHNFYFTMDQGNDAVHVREILERHQILLLGPETGIKGLFAGPLWYYFISIGYAIFRGDPFGAVFMMILLNVSLTALIMWKVTKEVSKTWAILIGFALQTSWWFYDTSRYGFNPFPLVFLAFLMLFLLTDFLKGNKKSFILAAIPIGLGFNTEVAGSVAFLIFYTAVGIWAIFKNKMNTANLLKGVAVIAIFLSPYLITEITSQTHIVSSLTNEISDPDGTFSRHIFKVTTPHLLKVISRASLRQIIEVGVALSTITILLAVYRWYSKKKANQFVKNYVTLTLVLLSITWIFFSSNQGWQEWHTVYVSTIIFVAVLLSLHEIPRGITILLLCISIISHTQIMLNRYLKTMEKQQDPSILYNEMAAVDWVYKKANGEGFYVHNYLPSVIDYPYQYLFWWQGKNKYGYVPCEYSTFPGSPKTNIPADKYYYTPKKECNKNIRFLIMEPDSNPLRFELWFRDLRKNTNLVEEERIGSIKVEKRMLVREP